MRSLILTAIVGVVTAMAGAVQAEEACRPGLMRFAKLDMTFDEGGRVNVPMTIGGKDVNLLVDTGGVQSMLTASTATAFGLEIRHSRNWFTFFGGEMTNAFVVVNDSRFGGMNAPRLQLYVVSDGRAPPGIGGLLAPDVMKNFDMDFDFANSALSLFSQDHCPDRVVYWTQSGYARVPFSEHGHITIPVILDGKEMQAIVDTGSVESVGRLESIESELDIDEKVPTLRPDSNDSFQSFRYPFKTLTFQGVTVNNPDIALVPRRYSGLPPDSPEIILGMNVLRRLHLYIAYGEHALYITSATAH